MDTSKHGYIPMQESLDLNKTQGASTSEEVRHMQNVPYASSVGSIMYAVANKDYFRSDYEACDMTLVVNKEFVPSIVEEFNAARPKKAVINAVKGNNVNAVKASACWVWKPKTKVLDYVSKYNSVSITLKKFHYTDAQGRSKLSSGFEVYYGVFFLATKDETSGILKSFITGIENLVDHKVKVIRCDNGTEFKNKEMNQFCEMKGKFDVKADEGFFVRYSLNSKAFRVFNSRTRIVEENLHIRFGKSTPNVVVTNASDNAGQARKETEPVKNYILLPLWTADPPFSQGPKSSHDDGFKPSSDDGKKIDEEPRKENECNDQEKEDNVNNTNNVNAASTNEVNAVGGKIGIELPLDPNMPELEDYSIFEDDEDVGAKADMHKLDTTIQVSPIPTTRIHKDHPLDQVIGDFHSATQTRRMSKSLEEHGKNLKRNKKDERGIVIRNKARLLAQGYTQEEGIDYDEVFSPIARIKAIRLFLAYASFKDFVVYQMDVKSAFLYGKIEEEVYVCQPSGFEDPDFPDRVYKVEKALYGLHQAPRAWYETLSTYLLDNEFQRAKINKTLFIKMHKSDILLMSSMGELTFFLGLQVHQKKDGIFISQDKYVDEILKKFGFTEVKNESTPIETQKPLLKDEDGEEVDVHMYLKGQPKLSLWYLKDSPFDLVAYTNSDYAGASLDRKTTTGGCQFLVCRLISWQCKKQTVVANSTTEAEYVAASSYEAVYKELDDSLVRAATTVSSLEAEQDSGNIINTRSKATPNEAGSQGTTSGGGPRGNTLRSGKNSLKLNELMELYKESLGEDASKQGRISDIDADDDITLVNVQDDAEMFDVGDLDGEEMIVAGQKENVVAEQEVVAKDVNLTVDEVTLAQALAAFKSAKPKVKGIVIEEPSIPVSVASTKVSTATTTTATILTPRKGIVIQEAGTTTTTPTTILPIPKPPQDKGKGIMFEEPMVEQAKVEADYHLAQRMQAQKQEELTDEEKARLFVQLLEQRRKHFAAKRAEEKRNKPPTKTQQKKTMITYLMNMEGWKHKDLKDKDFDSIKELFDKCLKRVNMFVDFRTELVEGSSKRAGTKLEQEVTKKQKVDDVQETTEVDNDQEIVEL
ncbi:retrovirus-related pol polyprotein from transposon TNT 1-94 [Tanacetum coccineum]